MDALGGAQAIQKVTSRPITGTQFIPSVNSREAYVVVGVPQGDTPERLYFDTRTDTGSGVKFPFLIQMNPANPRTELAPSATLRITKVDDTTVIDASKFAKPAASPR